MTDRTERVLLLNPTTTTTTTIKSQQYFDSDDDDDDENDPFLFPTRDGQKHIKTKSNNKMHHEQSPQQQQISFHSPSSQLQYNTYQNSHHIDDLSDSPQQVPIHSNEHKLNKSNKKGNKDQQQSTIATYNNNNNNNTNTNTTTNNNNGVEFAFKPQSKYDMKNHMANERTFFKYLFTGLHIGSIGTLVLTFFPNDDIHKLYLVIIIWLVAFFFMFWGLYGYYKRKHLMENGKLNDSTEISPHTPLLISSIFVGVILSVVWYGLFIHYKYENGISISKLLMMGEKETGRGRRRRNNRRNNNGGGKRRARKNNNNITNANNNDNNNNNNNNNNTNNNDNTAITNNNPDNSQQHQQHQQRQQQINTNNESIETAAGIYDKNSGITYQPKKFDPIQNNDATIDLNKSSTQSASILNFGTNNDNNDINNNSNDINNNNNNNIDNMASRKFLNQQSNGKPIGKHQPNHIVVQQTTIHGTSIEFDTTNLGHDQDEDGSYEYSEDDNGYDDNDDDHDSNGI